MHLLYSKKHILFVLFSLVVPSLTGCGGTTFDAKSTIYIEPFSGSGFGYKWIEELADEWKKESGYTYDVLVDRQSVYMAGQQLDQIASGISKTDIFFGGEPDYNPGIYKGYFENLEDLLDVRPDGDGTKTIKEKIKDWDTWQKVGSKVTYSEAADTFSYNGMYMLPYTVTISGLIFDYDSFEEKGLLIKAENSDEVKSALDLQGISYHIEGKNLVFDSSTSPTNYTVGRTIMSAGKDGKYGTYDDGQPITISEYNELINKILASSRTPFVFSTQGLYTDTISLPLLAQLQGTPVYNALCTFESGEEIELYDGTKKEITWENGYEVYKSKGIQETVQFLNDNFYDKKTQKASVSNQVSMAQSKFINGLLDDSNFYAFINEGNWFETEASESFKAAKKRGGKGYGEYDLRFLMLPEFEGQKGKDGEGHGSFISGPEYGAICVRKQEDAEKLKAIKSLLSFVLRNDNLSKVNVDTGLVWGYEYTIPEEMKSNMTLFQRNCYDVFHDTENVRVLCHKTDRLASPFTYASKSFNNSGTLLTVGKNGMTISGALQNGYSQSEIVNTMRTMYDSTSWKSVINEAKFFLS